VSRRFPRDPARKMVSVLPAVHERLLAVRTELEDDVQVDLTLNDVITTLLADRAQLLTLLEQR
jgi:hypothetical protein